jgi:hypothetical protein
MPARGDQQLAGPAEPGDVSRAAESCDLAGAPITESWIQAGAEAPNPRLGDKGVGFLQESTAPGPVVFGPWR